MQSDYGSDRKATFSQWLLIEQLDDCVREPKGGTRRSIDYNLALDLLEQRAGLLASEEARRYRFQHLSYQEYLAACELATPAYFPGAIVDRVLAQPGRWRNVVPLLWDIIKQRGDSDLGRLAQALLPSQDTAGLAADHVLWELLGQLARLQNQSQNLLSSAQKTVLAQHLAHLIECGALAPVERAEMGRILSLLGDPRAGVGTMIVQIDEGEVELPRIVWCDVPAPEDGKFVMGADDQSDNPRREVAMTYDFKMAKYLITYQQFQTFAVSSEYQHAGWWRDFPSEYRPQPMAEQNNAYDNHPRDSVSWYQAVAFARWLTTKYRAAGMIDDSVEIRLPTEQEWEYAARGSDERTYPYPGDFDAAKGNTSETGIEASSAVGLFPDGASPFGSLDMAGNLWEWCLNDYQHPAVVDGYGNGETKVLRGGSFFNGQYYAAASARYNLSPYYWFSSFGLRLVLSVPIASLTSDL